MTTNLKRYVDEWLRYEPDTGKLFWKKTANRGKRVAGAEAGTATCHGYKMVGLLGKSYRVHRIIFLIMVGHMPELVDHMDRDRSNNRWSNLREATHEMNCLNRNRDRRNKTGVTGVYFLERENVYTVTYRKEYLGRHKDFFEAVCIRKSKEMNDETK